MMATIMMVQMTEMTADAMLRLFQWRSLSIPPSSESYWNGPIVKSTNC